MYDRDRCIQCRYSLKLNEQDWCCAYILIKRERRGCYGSGDCEKFEKRKGKRRACVDLRGFGFKDE